MCGRYTNHATWAQVHAFTAPLTVATPAQDPEPAYNIAPSQNAWVILMRDGQAVAERLRWGLVPAWAKDTKIGYRTINARVETAATKPAFRAAWKARRCLVIATGYYEWRVEAGVKQPYWIHPKAGLMLFAGLWERNEQVAAQPLLSYTIITREAEGAVAALHNRMPFLLSREALGVWLTGNPDAVDAATMSTPAKVEIHAVNREIGNVRSQGEGLITAARLTS